MAAINLLDNSSGGLGGMMNSTGGNQSSVSDWYQNTLGRAGDQGGIDFWQNALNSGMNYNDVYGMFQQAANSEKGVQTPTTAPQAATPGLAQITSSSPGLTAGQKQAYAGLEKVNGTTWNDYIPDAGSFGTGLEGFLNADTEYQAMLGGGDAVDAQQIANARKAALARYQGKSTQDAANASRDYQIKAAQDSVDWWNAHPNGDDGFMTKLMGTVMPLIVGGGMGGAALGLFGDAAAGGAAAAGGGASGLGSIAAGTLPVDTGALSSLGWMDSALGTGAAAAGAGGAGAAGLGSMVGVQGGAPAVVTVGAPAASGMGLGEAAAGLGGLGAIAAGTLPVDTTSMQQLPNIPNPNDPTINPGTLPVPSFPVPTSIGSAPGAGSSTTPATTGTGSSVNIPGLGSIPIGSLIGGITDIIGGNVDRINNEQSGAYYQNLIDQMMGMYKPGTPEAELMKHQLEAKDAAAGRNSQYGIREQNLAGMLAQQRGQMMTSPVFSQLAQASRGHYDNSLNSLFSALGSGTSSGGLSSLLGGLGANALNSLFGNSTTTTPPTR